MVSTPIVLLAPAPNMSFLSLPSGSSYTSDRNALIIITNGSIQDEQALIAAGCTALIGGLVTTVAALPGATEGNRAFVTDATATMAAGIGTIVAGGGSNKVPVYADGANWLIG